jgi:hypothetical protein
MPPPIGRDLTGVDLAAKRELRSHRFGHHAEVEL